MKSHTGFSAQNTDHMKEFIKKHSDLILFIILAGLVLLVFINKDRLLLGREYSFKSVHASFHGTSGKTYVIDNARETIAVLENGDCVSSILQGGSNRRFYYAENIAEGENGEIYILDEVYNDENAETRFRIVSLKNNKYRVEQDLGENRVFDLQYRDGSLFYLRQEDYGLGFYSFNSGEEPALKKRIYAGDYLNDASIDLDTGLTAIATKRGAVRIQEGAAATWLTLDNKDNHIMPGCITARNGYVFFSDYYTGGISGFSEDSVDSFYPVYSENALKIRSINGSPDGKRLLASDGISFYDIRVNDDITAPEVKYQESVAYSGFYITVLLWLCVLISLIIVLRFMRFIPGFLIKILKDESSLRMAVVVIAVLSVTCFTASSLLSDERIKEDEADISSMKLFSDMTLEKMDTDSLSLIHWEYDYMGSAYMRYKTGMDELMEKAGKEGRNYYYSLYNIEDDTVRYVINYDDTVMCGEPYGRMDDSYIRDVYENRSCYALKNQNADGLWLSVLQPVVSTDGRVTAVLEIGTDLSYRQMERRNQTINTVIGIFCSSAVVMMIIIEALFLISFYENRPVDENGVVKDVTRTIPLRTVVVLAYITSTMQDPFIVVLVSRLYNEGLHIPQGFATGLPLSANLFMMAVASAVGGRLSEKAGSRKTLFAGLIIDIAGFLICALLPTYYGILGGNLLIGTGMGLIIVTCNVLAAMGDSMESTAEAFAGIMAGVLSGLTIGAGLSSIIFPVGGSRLAYLSAAAFMVPAFIIIKFSRDAKPDKDSKEDKKQEIGFVRFFFNPRVLGFFALILVPFMTSLSYREYFFPLFATEHGIDEVRIGQIYLLCGLVVIYIGPYISAAVIRKFGTFWSVVIASICMGLNMLLFVIRPTLITVISGVVILSIIISFAYTCQYTYFEQLPDSLMYGDGKSMGIYSVFENLGQTIGPVVYGMLLSLGYRKGIFIFAVLMLIFVLFYIFSMRNQKKFYK